MTWADEKMIELNNKPREQWTVDDWDSYHYIEQLRFENGQYDTSSVGYDYESELGDTDVFCELENSGLIENSFSTEDIKYLYGLVSMGLDAGLVLLSVKENEMVAQIGDYWFYFDGSYVEDSFDFTSVPKEELVREISDALVEIKEDIAEEEYFYYISFLEESLVKELKEELEPQLETERDGYDNPIGFISFGNDSIELTFEKESAQYSVLMHDKDGTPRLPYISAKELDVALKGAISDYSISGAVIVCNNLLKDNIREWYMEKYPSDELGPELAEELSFDSFYKGMQDGKCVYEMFGVGDSIIRERVFSELSDRLHVDYDVIYRLWHDGPKNNSPAKPNIDDKIHDGESVVNQKKISNKEKKELLGDSLKWREK